MIYSFISLLLAFFSSLQLFANENYLLEKRVEIPELKASLTVSVHKESGVQVVHVHAPHEAENFFCIAFRTLPDSSKGEAHILEHVVLQGSKKFSTHGLFDILKERSCATFLNAFTTADATCYVAASLIPKDFYNIFEVYLDAVFYPLITPFAVAQEGFRKELTDNGAVVYKGVVFNEMKGALASPQARLHRMLYEELFPHTLYRFESGGDPLSIPEISPDALLSFHNTYYKPSNCSIFLYGDIPLEEHLEFLDRYLPKCQEEQSFFEVPLQEPLLAPVRKEFGEGEDCIVGFSWLTTHALNYQEIMALSLIDTILMGSDGGLLKEKLLQSGLCAEAQGQLDVWKVQVPYFLVAEGCKKEYVDKLEEALFEALTSIVEEGIPQKLIQNAFGLHKMLLSKTRTANEPFGMELFERSRFLHMSGGEIEKVLAPKQALEELRLLLEQEPRYLEGRIFELLLTNPHFVRISFDPKAPIVPVLPSLSDVERESVVQMQKELQGFQNRVIEDKNIPKISLEEILLRRKQEFQKRTFEDRAFYCLPTFTNGLTHADLIIPMPFIEELWIARLFCDLVPELGFVGSSWQETLHYVESFTDGVTALPLVLGEELYVSLSAKSFTKEKLIEILSSMAQELNFQDKDRIRECIKKIAVRMKNSVDKLALQYCLSDALSQASSRGYVMNEWYGLEYYKNIEKLVENDDICEKLQAFYKGLTGGVFILVCDQEEFDRFIHESASSDIEISRKKHTFLMPEKEARREQEISSPVAYNAVGFYSAPFLHEESASLAVAAALMSKTLHTHIRERRSEEHTSELQSQR